MCSFFRIQTFYCLTFLIYINTLTSIIYSLENSINIPNSLNIPNIYNITLQTNFSISTDINQCIGYKYNYLQTDINNIETLEPFICLQGYIYSSSTILLRYTQYINIYKNSPNELNKQTIVDSLQSSNIYLLFALFDQTSFYKLLLQAFDNKPFLFYHIPKNKVFNNIWDTNFNKNSTLYLSSIQCIDNNLFEAVLQISIPLYYPSLYYSSLLPLLTPQQIVTDKEINFIVSNITSLWYTNVHNLLQQYHCNLNAYNIQNNNITNFHNIDWKKWLQYCGYIIVAFIIYKIIFDPIKWILYKIYHRFISWCDLETRLMIFQDQHQLTIEYGIQTMKTFLKLYQFAIITTIETILIVLNTLEVVFSLIILFQANMQSTIQSTIQSTNNNNNNNTNTTIPLSIQYLCLMNLMQYGGHISHIILNIWFSYALKTSFKELIKRTLGNLNNPHNTSPYLLCFWSCITSLYGIVNYNEFSSINPMIRFIFIYGCIHSIYQLWNLRCMTHIKSNQSNDMNDENDENAIDNNNNNRIDDNKIDDNKIDNNKIDNKIDENEIPNTKNNKIDDRINNTTKIDNTVDKNNKNNNKNNNKIDDKIQVMQSNLSPHITNNNDIKLDIGIIKSSKNAIPTTPIIIPIKNLNNKQQKTKTIKLDKNNAKKHKTSSSVIKTKKETEQSLHLQQNQENSIQQPIIINAFIHKEDENSHAQENKDAKDINSNNNNRDQKNDEINQQTDNENDHEINKNNQENSENINNENINNDELLDNTDENIHSEIQD